MTNTTPPINQALQNTLWTTGAGWNSPIGLKPALQHYILSFEQLFQDSNVGSNGIHPILAIPNRTQHGLQAASSGLESVRDRQKHSGSLLSGGVQGPHHPHRKQWISLHRNPPGNRRGNAHLPHDSRSSSLLYQNGPKSPVEVPTFPRHKEAKGGRTSSMVHRGLHSGLGAPGSNRPSRGRGRCTKPICLGSRVYSGHPSSTSPSPGPWVWEQPDSDTDWVSLSDCIIIVPPEPEPEPTPPPTSSIDFHRSRIENWIVQRAKHTTQFRSQARPASQAKSAILENAAPGSRKEVVRHVRVGAGARQERISEVSSPLRIQAINSPEPSTSSSTSSSNSSQKRLRQSRARDKRSHQYLKSLEGSSSKLFASAAVLTDRSQQTRVSSNTEFVSRVSRISATMAELVTEVEEALQMTKNIYIYIQTQFGKSIKSSKTGYGPGFYPASYAFK